MWIPVFTDQWDGPSDAVFIGTNDHVYIRGDWAPGKPEAPHQYSYVSALWSRDLYFVYIQCQDFSICTGTADAVRREAYVDPDAVVPLELLDE